ncbi:hypothetical protein QJS66_07505 [Kocuria rhizophila]|nr:hypothetical protein QJS66_07505 [Kocuria rhizophila]
MATLNADPDSSCTPPRSCRRGCRSFSGHRAGGDGLGRTSRRPSP